MADISEAFRGFHSWRGCRKISLFGSSRAQSHDPCYRLAEEVAQLAVEAGFEVMTGAGGGVMEAANVGAGSDHSIGLNVNLPYEQQTHLFVGRGEGRLLNFRYFFTRKLFFLRESDALVVMPGGFGTFDELFESLTLIQAGRIPPIPLVLLAPVGDDFWSCWSQDMHARLCDRGLISPEDPALLVEASSAIEAVHYISSFYRTYSSARFEENRIELLLNAPIPQNYLATLNQMFIDLPEGGSIDADESVDGSGLPRPCLRLRFDKRKIGRLYQFIDHLNGLDLPACPALEHPGERTSRPALQR